MSRERFGRHVPPQERRPVAWYAPIGLRQIAQQQLWSTRLLHNLDRRETFTDAAAPFGLIDLRELQADGAFWFDFVADTGDGGAPTYTVARGLLAPQLHAEGAATPLPEGRLLLLGGDLAYPAASPELYQSRLVEMFELARDGRPPERGGSRFRPVPADLPNDAPWSPEHKLVAAIAQNHDWFDSASTFCRYFVQDEKAGLVGARAPQTRSYFAIALPHDWYVLGFDFALTGDLDRQQYEAFARLVTRGALPRGAQLLLIYPEPYWTRPFDSHRREAYPQRYERLEHLCAEHGLHVRLRLAGDLHHYVREHLSAVPPGDLSCELITCGSGGAFGHATHTREVTEPKVLQWASEPDAVPDELRGRVRIGRVRDAAHAAELGLCTGSQGSDPSGIAGADRAGTTAAGTPPTNTTPTTSATSATATTQTASRVCWPDLATSRHQAWGNLLALLRPRGEWWWASNLAFTLLLGALLLIGGGAASALFGPTLAWVLPWPVVLAADATLLVIALMLATDNDPALAGWPERLWGLALGVLLVALALGLGDAVAQLSEVGGLAAGWLAAGWPAGAAPVASTAAGTAGWTTGAVTLAAALLRVLLGWALATVLGGLVVGAFLLLLGRWGGRAVTNTSSALSLQGHKGFLRFRVHAEGLEAWMLGCDEVPQRWVPRPGPGGHPADAAAPWWEPAADAAPLRWRVVDHFVLRRAEPTPAAAPPAEAPEAR